LNDPKEFTESELHSVVENIDERTFFLTKKEHPLIKDRLMHYLHECKMADMFQGDANEINRVAKWASVVFPMVFGLSLINLEVMKKL
jgi:hypothetical protein